VILHQKTDDAFILASAAVVLAILSILCIAVSVYAASLEKNIAANIRIFSERIENENSRVRSIHEIP
jgi:hypothetical protein